MEKGLKFWLITAVLLIIIGAVIFAYAMTMCGWDFTRLSTVKYESVTHKVEDEFSVINIDTGAVDITLLPSADGECSIVSYTQEKLKHTVSVENDVLTVKRVDEREWYEYVTLFDFNSASLIVYLPESEYSALAVNASTGDVNISESLIFESIDVDISTGDVTCASSSANVNLSTSTGDITVENVKISSLNLSASTGDVRVRGAECNGTLSVSVTTGDVTLSDITCKELVSAGDTGDITLKSVVALGKVSVERSTGDVILDACDGGEIFIKTDTGMVSGTLISDKTFIAETSTGNVNVPKTVGARCEIITDTGDINIKIAYPDENK